VVVDQEDLHHALQGAMPNGSLSCEAKVPTNAGRSTLGAGRAGREPEGMTTTLADERLELVLDTPTCLELVDRSGAATLACTVKAMPVVVPVSVRVTRAAIEIGLPDIGDQSRLAGQIVALGTGVAATPRSPGWWVVIRGELVERGGRRGSLVLEPFDVEGWALPATARGAWWRC
jgi:hypothetical protein